MPLIPVITVGFPFHPDHCRGFSLPNKLTVKLRTFSISRPSSRCMVTEQVQRQIAAAFRYHLDHCRGISLQNNFTVELPMFPSPSRPLPRCSVTEQLYSQIADVFHSHPDQHRDGSLPNKVIIKLPVFPLVHRIYGAFPRLSTYHRRVIANTVELPQVPLFHDHR